MMQPAVGNMVQMIPVAQMSVQDAQLLHLQPRLLQYQEKCNSWKTCSIVFFVLTLLILIFQFSTDNYAGGVASIFGMVAFALWYKASAEGFSAVFSKQWNQLENAVNFHKYSCWAFYAYIGMYLVAIMIAVIWLMGINGDDSLDQDEKDLITFLVIYIIIVPLVIFALFIFCFLCTCRGHRDMAQNLVLELKSCGALQGVVGTVMQAGAQAVAFNEQQQQQQQYQQQQQPNMQVKQEQ